LQDVEPETFYALLKFIYSGEAEISEENIWKLLSIGSMYDVGGLQDVCINYLSSYMSLNNCLQVYEFADMHSLPFLKEKALDFILNDFEEFSEKEQFLEISFSLLKQLIQNDSLRVTTEMSVLNAIKKWTSFQPEEGSAEEKNRSKYIQDLLLLVRFPFMSQEDLQSVEEDKEMMQYPVMNSVLLEAWKCRARPTEKKFFDTPRAKRRKMDSNNQCTFYPNNSNMLFNFGETADLPPQSSFRPNPRRIVKGRRTIRPPSINNGMEGFPFSLPEDF